MGGERASFARMRYAGMIWCECKMPLPPPHKPPLVGRYAKLLK